MNKVDVRLEVRESNLRDEIDAWKDASGIDGVKTPEMLRRHIANLNRNIEALDKSSALTLKQRDNLSMLIGGLQCKNKGWCEIFNIFGAPPECGHCDVCLVKRSKDVYGS